MFTLEMRKLLISYRTFFFFPLLDIKDVIQGPLSKLTLDFAIVTGNCLLL